MSALPYRVVCLRRCVLAYCRHSHYICIAALTHEPYAYIIVTSDDLGGATVTLNQWGFQQSRIISGRGIMRPSLSVTARAHRYFVKVIRFPETNFENGKWNPDRSEYAKITYVSGGYVWKELTLNYPKQVYSPEIIQSEAYLNTYLWCHFRDIEERLVSIQQAPAIGVTPELPPSLEIQGVVSPIDEIRIVCRDDTAIQIQEYILLNDNPCSQSLFLNAPKWEPDDEEEIVSPGTPIEVTRSYFPPNDNGNTVPFSGDSFPPPPPAACTTVSGTVSFKFSFNPNTFTDSVSGLAPARVVVNNQIGSGFIQRQTSQCSGGVLISEYTVTSFIDQAVGGAQLIYDFVTCDNPNIPVVFL